LNKAKYEKERHEELEHEKWCKTSIFLVHDILFCFFLTTYSLDFTPRREGYSPTRDILTARKTYDDEITSHTYFPVTWTFFASLSRLSKSLFCKFHLFCGVLWEVRWLEGERGDFQERNRMNSQWGCCLTHYEGTLWLNSREVVLLVSLTSSFIPYLKRWLFKKFWYWWVQYKSTV
jgi:hypothetical protein